IIFLRDGGYAAYISVPLCPDYRFPVLRTGGFTAPVYPSLMYASQTQKRLIDDHMVSYVAEHEMLVVNE
ncbi:hypothetical protein, partial [Oribacterium sp. HCP3S3_B9]|uniref:hypothetical protein n=1 Tax=Oribacterium sp. HCP3S3_B9 TaxID=3438946 RepID=UPI003F8CA10D